MIILKEELISVRPHGNTKEHYAVLGYDLSLSNMQVKSCDIHNGGSQLVVRICCECGDEKELPRHKVPDSGLCKKCATSKSNELRKDATKKTCPTCGENKSYQATTCDKCKPRGGIHNGMFGRKNPNGGLATSLRSGDKHWNWKGGNTRVRSGKQISWSRKVKEEYEYKCDCCGYDRVIALEAHHYQFSEGKHHNDFNSDNGVALCSNCHKEFHKKYSFGDNNYEQYQEFKENY